MPVPDHYSTLIKRLIDKAPVLDWKEMPGFDSFSVSFSNFSLEIGSERDSNDVVEGVVVRLRNSEGRQIDCFTLYLGVDRKDFMELRKVLDEARRKARNIDDAIKAISQELDDTMPF